MGVRLAVFEKIVIFIFALLIMFPGAVQAVELGSDSGFPVPRFVSLRASKVYARTGPALRYPIKWVYTQENLPVEITSEFDTWRRIRDPDGEESWVHKSMLDGTRHIMIQADAAVTLTKDIEADSRPVVMVEPKVVARLEECVPGLCQISAEGYKGWVQKDQLWGVYDHELYED